jgi:hypothetical protein
VNSNDLNSHTMAHVMVVHPLQPALDSKLFNEQWFDGKLPMEEPIYEVD